MTLLSVENWKGLLRPMALIGIKKENFKMNALIGTGSDRTISFMDPFGYRLGVGDDLEGEPDTIRGLSGEERLKLEKESVIQSSLFSVIVGVITFFSYIKYDY